MTHSSLLFAAVIAAVPAFSFAQDFAGPYAGFQIGTSDIDVDGAPLDGDGPSYGLFAGFNVQNGGVVYGAEIDYDTTEYDIGDGTAEVDSTTRLKGRVGSVLGGGMAYGTAGVVWATSPGLGDDNGGFVGAGYDFPVTDDLDIGFEVLQHQFEDYNDSGLDVGVTTLKLRASFSF
ncbi:MAG: outer membrane beta-barrel protein [Pseudomonadota bacterium]